MPTDAVAQAGKEGVKKMSEISPSHQLDQPLRRPNDPPAESSADVLEPDLDLDSDREGSERGVVESKQVERFEGKDTVLHSFTLPPKDHVVQSYSSLYNYFIQSSLIFDAFRQRFRLARSASPMLTW